MIYYLIISYMIMTGVLVKFANDEDDFNFISGILVWLFSPLMLPIIIGARIIK